MLGSDADIYRLMVWEIWGEGGACVDGWMVVDGVDEGELRCVLGCLEVLICCGWGFRWSWEDFHIVMFLCGGEMR